MYIRMYDELKRHEGDNPTIGIVLCSNTDEDIARYSVLHGNEQLFASKYKLYLLTEKELRAEIEMQKAMFYLRQKENKDDWYKCCYSIKIDGEFFTVSPSIAFFWQFLQKFAKSSLSSSVIAFNYVSYAQILEKV